MGQDGLVPTRIEAREWTVRQGSLAKPDKATLLGLWPETRDYTIFISAMAQG